MKGFPNAPSLSNFKREGITEFKDTCIYLMNVVSCMFQNLSQVGQTKVGHFMHVRVHMDFKWPTYKEYCKKYQVYETFYHTLLGQD